MADRIRLRRDTAANWMAANPVLLLAEAGWETDTGKLKIGDGSTAWNSLTYAAKSFIWKGDYNASTAYKQNDVVYYQGQSYICILDCTNTLPTVALNWNLMAAKGADGANGVDGSDGHSVLWKGQHSTDVSYNFQDLVTSSGTTYIALQYVPVGTLVTNTTYWSVFAAKGSTGVSGSSLVWRGTFASNLSYSLLDVVFYQGSSYVCIQQTTNQTPQNSLYWSLIASKGSDGAAGADGTDGINGTNGLSINWRGAYSQTTQYSKLDAVSYAGSSYLYIHTADSIGSPLSNPLFWAMMSSKGDTGRSINWLGAYSAGTQYAYFDAVSFNGSSYLCTKTDGSLGNDPTNAAFWSVLAQKGDTGSSGSGSGASIVWKGAYDDNTTYSVGNAVSYLGSSFLCVNTTIGHLPSVGGSLYWNLLAQKGADGATGADGAIGATGASIVWKGAYSPSAFYDFLDAVSYNGSSYICKWLVGSHGNLPTDTGYWDLMASKGADGSSSSGSSFSWKGQFSPSDTYAVSDAVSYEGTSYIAIAASTNKIPSSTTGYWEVLALKGSSFNWIGEYSSLTTYSKQDVVSYNGSSYIYIASTSSSGNVPTDTSYWGLLAQKGTNGTNGANGAAGTSIIWRGAYSPSTAYSANDVVSYNGSSYICTNSTTNNAPTNAAYWDVLSSKGDTGDTGATGSSGTYTAVAGSKSSRFVATANQSVFAPILGYTSTDVEAYLVSVGAQDQAPTVNYTITSANGGSLVLSEGVSEGTVVLVRALNAVQNQGGSGNATQIQGIDVSSTTPTNGQALVFDSLTNSYKPASGIASSVSFARTRYIGNGQQRKFYPIQGYIDNDETKYLVTVSSLLNDSDETNGEFIVSQDNGGTITFTGSVPAEDSKIVCRVLGGTGNLEVAKKSRTVITSGPSSITKQVGESCSFSVSATGSGTLSYQWYRNGVLLNGQTSSTISGTAGAGMFTNGASFFVSVESSGGYVVSGSATITVSVQSPVITSQPQAHFDVISGDTFTVSVSASGEGPLSYMWVLDGSVLVTGGDVTSPTITVQARDLVAESISTPLNSTSPMYCVVTNAGGSVNSSGFSVTVFGYEPRITSNLPSTASCTENQTSAQVTVSAVGLGTLNYFWEEYNGTSWIPYGTDSRTQLLPNDYASNGYKFRVSVSNQYGTVVSSECTLTVNRPAVTLDALNDVNTYDWSFTGIQPSAFSGTIENTVWKWYNYSNQSLLGSSSSATFSGAVVTSDGAYPPPNQEVTPIRLEVNNNSASVSFNVNYYLQLLGLKLRDLVVNGVTCTGFDIGGDGYNDYFEASINLTNGVYTGVGFNILFSGGLDTIGGGLIAGTIKPVSFRLSYTCVIDNGDTLHYEGSGQYGTGASGDAFTQIINSGYSQPPLIAGGLWANPESTIHFTAHLSDGASSWSGEILRIFNTTSA